MFSLSTFLLFLSFYHSLSFHLSPLSLLTFFFSFFSHSSLLSLFSFFLLLFLFSYFLLSLISFILLHPFFLFHSISNLPHHSLSVAVLNLLHFSYHIAFVPHLSISPVAMLIQRASVIQKAVLFFQNGSLSLWISTVDFCPCKNCIHASIKFTYLSTIKSKNLWVW